MMVKYPRYTDVEITNTLECLIFDKARLTSFPERKIDKRLNVLNMSALVGGLIHTLQTKFC